MLVSIKQQIAFVACLPVLNAVCFVFDDLLNILV